MKQSKGLNGDLKPEHKLITNRTTMSPTTDIDIQASTIWNKLKFNYITKTCLFKYRKFYHQKMKIFRLKKKSDIFHISVQNINCGCSLEPPRQGGSNG